MTPCVDVSLLCLFRPTPPEEYADPTGRQLRRTARVKRGRLPRRDGPA